ncbi:unnamed protein product [marine sediment metagenome]|uniref:Uncharacterized protein n=1 Tax=marine sediment metagenome TaxID=412755 RepID=X0YIQ1_9ZZZZ
MEVKIGAEYWTRLHDDLKAFAKAMGAFHKAHERLTMQALIVETAGSDEELERANRLAENLGADVKFERKDPAGD